MTVIETEQAAPSWQDDFGAFVSASSPGLTRLATLLLGDRHDVEEAVQETYTRVFKHWHKIAQSGDPYPYARSVLANLTKDHWRYRRQHPVDRWTNADLELVALPPSNADRLDLLANLRALPGRRRAVVVMRIYCDMSEREVADALKISPGAVKSALSRGLSQLRVAMEGFPR